MIGVADAGLVLVLMSGGFNVMVKNHIGATYHEWM